jgi:hypothetical protein
VLNEALKHIIHLENGLVGEVSTVSDPGQLRELQKAKTGILAAIRLAGGREGEASPPPRPCPLSATE